MLFARFKGPAQMIAAEGQERLVSATLLLGFAVACVLVGGALLFVSASPYELVLRLSRLATGSENPLTRAMYGLLCRRMVAGGVFYGAVGTGLLFFHRRLVPATARVVRSLCTCAAETRQAVGRYLSCETKWHVSSLGLITFGGILARVTYLSEPPRVDESLTYVAFAKRSIVHVLTLYPAPNNHVLHSVLVWISCRVLGNSLWAMRLPALLAGVALILLVYLTARRLAGRNAALLAAGLIAVSGPFVLYSVNARGYAQQAVLLVVMLYLATELVAGATASYWVLFAAATVAGFWTAPTMLYSYLIVLIWLIWEGGQRMLRPAIITSTITALAIIFVYMPLIIVSGPAALFSNPWVRPWPWQDFRADALEFPRGLLNFLHGSDPLFYIILVGAGVLLGLVFRNPAGARLRHLFIVLLLVLVSVPAMQRVVPFPRVLLPVFTLYYLVAAFGWSIAAEKWFPQHQVSVLVAFLLLLGGMALHLTRSGYVQAHREFPESGELATYLARQLRPCDRLIIGWPAQPELEWQLYHAHVPCTEYTQGSKAPGRVLVVVQDMGALPPRNSRLDPSLLTLDGTLRDVGLNTTKYLPPSLIHKVGQGQVFQFIPRLPVSGCQGESIQSRK
jgi:hypothetical protein